MRAISMYASTTYKSDKEYNHAKEREKYKRFDELDKLRKKEGLTEIQMKEWIKLKRKGYGNTVWEDMKELLFDAVDLLRSGKSIKEYNIMEDIDDDI